MAFTHLHVHTEYSLLDGSNKITSYVTKVKEAGMTSAAITDHGVMYGVIYFYKECSKQGIHPILGCEVYVAPHSRFEHEKTESDDNYYHLILLAENNTGYANLMKLVSIGYAEGFYKKPRVDFETLEKYHEGLIALSACLAGQVPRLIQRHDYEGAKELALKYEACFGKGNYFLELQDHGIAAQAEVNRQLLRMSEETGIELVATNDCHYTNEKDATAHDILLCIQTNKKVMDADRMRYEGGQFYVKTEEEMRQLFPYAQKALDNTQKIADRCHVDIEFGVTKLPHFNVPQGYNSWSYLNHLCFEGLQNRYPKQQEETSSVSSPSYEQLEERLHYELEVIHKMGYVDYFLIVWDFINYARTHGIPVGPGRGSAAGSLVSYTTGITNIDPIKYDLIFERFLNPDRVSMPDIDVDFCYERRSEVIDYVVEKYGKECVTQIITFGTMKAKNAIRDVGRALDLPYTFVDKVAKNIPDRLPDEKFVTIAKAVEKNPQLREMYESDEAVKNLIDTAQALEGLPRHSSMHAAGVVISERPMDEYVPLSRAVAGGPLVTQFEKDTIEELGLLKMDFLGLRTLTVIDDAVNAIQKVHGVQLDIDNLDLFDKSTYELLASGHTEGVFQLESAGMRSFMKELKPDAFEDIIAGISLYRPGPMEFIPAYLRGRQNRDGIEYECPQLEPILKMTFGCMVYQEQVMQIVRDLAGFSMGRSDEVRRAMSKKKTTVMEHERAAFVYGDPEHQVAGCIANGISEKVANHIYDEMIDFGKYAFNKSHAAGYAVVAFQTAYLKCHYPLEFFAALMTSVLDNSTKVSEYIQVCRSMNIELLPPDVNIGSGPFSVADGKIRYGMYSIKSVGRPVIDAIVEERESHGSFVTLNDFFERMNGRDVNKRNIENLIKAGALDSLEGNRRQKMQIYPVILDDLNQRKKNTIVGQMNMFDTVDDSGKKLYEVKLPTIDEYEKSELLAFEKEVLGIYISGHPLEDDIALMKKNVTASSLDFMLQEEDDTQTFAEDIARAQISDGANVVLGGLITEKTLHFTKNNQAMAFFTMEDLYGTVEMIAFPKTYEKYRNLIEEDAKVLVYGRASVEENKDAKLLVQQMVLFSEISSTIWIRFETLSDYEEKTKELIEIASRYPGNDEVMIHISEDKLMKSLGNAYKVKENEYLLEELKEAFGTSSIAIVPGEKRF